MKTSQDPRHLRRIRTLEQLFAQSFQSSATTDTEAQAILNSCASTLDTIIEGAAPEWPLPKIAKIDLAILRLAAYEMLIEKQVPQKVIIDEAVELAKAYGNENSPKFVNGVLGTILKSQKP